jgi:DMSO reductase anchor subunit
MTKCNLCYDNLDAGLPPACVAACPMRCLELISIDEPGIDKKGLPLWEIPGDEHPFPIPKRSRTGPHLVIKPHPAIDQVGKDTIISNREETSPPQPHLTARGEIPLIFFTLFAQMAVGAFWSIFLICFSLRDKLLAGTITLIPLFVVGAMITSALFFSFLHLKNPRKAWRAMIHLRKSWLSREILFTTGFAGSWAVITGMRLFQIGTFSLWISLAALAGLIGVAAVYSMQRVYQLRSILAWNSNRTMLEFFISSVVLGSLLTGSLLPGDTPAGVITCIAVVAMLAFSGSLGIIASKNNENKKLMRWRTGLLLVSLLVASAIVIWPASIRMGSMVLVLFSSLAEEAIGRYLFYSRRNPGI